MGKAGVQYLVFVCWVTLWTQTDVSVMELNLSTSFIEHMNCSLMVELLCIFRMGPADLGRSWALEGALTTIDTSKVKNVFSKAPKIMKYMCIPLTPESHCCGCFSMCHLWNWQETTLWHLIERCGQTLKTLLCREGGFVKNFFLFSDHILFFKKNDTFKNFFFLKYQFQQHDHLHLFPSHWKRPLGRLHSRSGMKGGRQS